MARKKGSMATMEVDLDRVGAVVGGAMKPKATGKVGRHGRDIDQAQLKRLSLAISADLHKRLKHTSVETGRTMVELVETAVAEYLTRQEAQP